MSKTKRIRVMQHDSEFMNNQTFIQIYNMIKEFTINVFEWINLPDTIDERFLESVLFENGSICVFKDYDVNEIFALQSTNTAPFGIYGDPTKFRIFSRFNGYTRYRNANTAVLVWNNRLRKSTSVIAQLYASRIADSQRTADININAQKTPIVIICKKDQLLTMQNMYDNYEGNRPIIIGDEDILDIDKFKTLETKAPFVANDIMMYKRELLNEYFTLIGINNANVDKKERMITGEVESNNDQIEHAKFNMLNARKDACKKINKMFGLNLDVKFRETETHMLMMANEYAEIKRVNAEGNKFNAEAEDNILTLDDLTKEGGVNIE